MPSEISTVPWTKLVGRGLGDLLVDARAAEIRRQPGRTALSSVVATVSCEEQIGRLRGTLEALVRLLDEVAGQDLRDGDPGDEQPQQRDRADGEHETRARGDAADGR